MRRLGTDSVRGVLFSLVLVLPSAGTISHYSALGYAGLILYLLIAVPLLTLWYIYSRVFESRLVHIKWLWIALSVSLLVFVVALSTLGYDLANRHIIWGDNLRDEMLDGLVKELLNGRYPYHFVLGPEEVAGELPGAIMLAIPFVL